MRRITPKGRLQFPTLFHGTASTLDGGKVNPTPDLMDRQSDSPLAWATPDYDMAESFAFSAARNEGRLFGSVYEVEPSGTPFRHNQVPEFIADKDGYTEKRHVDFATEKRVPVSRTPEEYHYQMNNSRDMWSGRPYYEMDDIYDDDEW